MKNDNLENFKELYRFDSAKVATLREIYAENPYHARVYYMNDARNFEGERVMLFEKKDKDFAIVSFVRKHGMSVTNRIYSRERRNWSIYYSKGKLWYKSEVGVRNLTRAHFGQMVKEVSDPVKEYLFSRFPWMEFLFSASFAYDVTFNKVLKNKLFGLKKLAREHYKLPYPICKLIIADNTYQINEAELIQYRKYMINVESLTFEFMSDKFLPDTLKMARVLGHSVNCSWSIRRLKEVHDKWSEEVTNILYDCTPSAPLNIAKPYVDFAEKSGYNLITDSKDLIHEGRKQKHCVATYIDVVNSGRSAIYSVGEYTLEIKINHDKTLHINQCRGLNNKDCDPILRTQIQHRVDSFNEKFRQPDQVQHEKASVEDLFEDHNIMML